MELAEYHALHTVPTPHGPLVVKKGVPGLGEPAYALLARTLEAKGTALDLNPGLGVVSLAMLAQGANVTAVEDRRPALRALTATAAAHPRLQVAAAAPWNAPREEYDTVALVLAGERGNEFVRVQLQSAAAALKEGGALWIAGERKRGFERYLRWAKELVGPGEVVAREKNVRVAVLEKSRPGGRPEVKPQQFAARLRGREVYFYSLPGVFSAGSVDAASSLLLRHLPDVSGAELLDLGAGYGALGLPLALEGARVTMLEQSLIAVESTRLGVAKAGAAAAVLHSDVDEALQNGILFDIVVMNPPFHVGGSVVLDVAEAFVAAAHARLRPGGRFYLVANPFLKYERWMHDRFGNVRELFAGRYKVLQSSKE